jgi:hypothetical protein
MPPFRRTAIDPPKERLIVTFEDIAVMDRFQVTTDQVLGGQTKAVFEHKHVGALTCGEWHSRPILTFGFAVCV